MVQLENQVGNRGRWSDDKWKRPRVRPSALEPAAPGCYSWKGSITTSNPQPMLDVFEITRLHDEATLRWHGPDPWPLQWPSPPSTLVEAALANHRANFDLWHEEDKAREPDATDSRIAAVKRSID